MITSQATAHRFIRWHPIALLALSLGLDLLMGSSLGAKYWYDTIAYFQIANVIFDPAALRMLFEGDFGLTYQHLAPGLPLLIAIFDGLFGQSMWPTFALFQYTLSGAATAYFALALGSRLKTSTRYFLVAAITTFPYFSAFHGAFLTESVASSIVLFVFGLLLRAIDGKTRTRTALAAILILAVLGGLLRTYVAGIGGACALIVVFSTYRLKSVLLYGVVLGATAAGFFAFPIYRAAVGLGFGSPNVDAWMLAHTSYVAWDFTPAAIRAVNEVVKDEDLRAKLNSSQDQLAQDDVFQMVGDLVSEGMTRSEAGKAIAGAAWIVRTQSVEVLRRQVQLSLSSLGFIGLATCCDPNRLVMRGGYTNEGMRNHLGYYFRWNAGADAGDYRQTFAQFADAYRAVKRLYSAPVIDWYFERVASFVKSQPDLPRVAITTIWAFLPVDLLIVAGLVGFVLLVRGDWRLLLALGLTMAAIYMAALSASVVGDNRHAHPLWPLYLAGVAGLVELLVATVAAWRTRSTVVSLPVGASEHTPTR